eukprot:1188561-Prorocentrum_minimum.AAC.2
MHATQQTQGTLLTSNPRCSLPSRRGGCCLTGRSRAPVPARWLLPYRKEPCTCACNILPVPARWLLPYWKEPADPSRDSPCTKGLSNRNIAKGAPGGPEGSAGVLLSTDLGQSWHPKGDIQTGGSWLIEGTLATKSDGSVLHYFRSKKGVIYSSVSADGGSSWKKPKPTKMPNPNSKVRPPRPPLKC